MAVDYLAQGRDRPFEWINHTLADVLGVTHTLGTRTSDILGTIHLASQMSKVRLKMAMTETCQKSSEMNAYIYFTRSRWHTVQAWLGTTLGSTRHQDV